MVMAFVKRETLGNHEGRGAGSIACRIALLLLGVMASACENPFDFDETDRLLRVATIYGGPDEDYYPLDISLDATDDAVRVVIATYGSSCTTTGRLAVEKAGSEVEITPYNYHIIRTSSGSTVIGCVEARHSFVHVGTIRLHGPRPWTVAIRGLQSWPPDTITVVRVVE